MNPVSPLPGFYRRIFVFLLLFPVTLVRPVSAEYPWAEEIPWSFLENEPALHFLADQFDDRVTGWQVGSLGLSGVVRSGDTNRAYVRWRYLAFSRAGRDIFSRWPNLSAENSVVGWPGENQGSGWGRPELGFLGRSQAPLSGPLEYGVTIHLPFAKNDLYPFSSQSTSLRLAVRKSRVFTSGMLLAAHGGLIRNLGGVGDDLADAAFPAVRFWGLEMWRARENGRSFGLDFTATTSDNSVSRVLSAVLGLPLGGKQAMEIGIARDFAPEEDRFYSIRLFLRLIVPLVPKQDGDDQGKRESSRDRGQPSGDIGSTFKESG